MSTGADVVAAARSEMGTPWVVQGRLPGVALDCLGLVVVAAKAVGASTDGWSATHYGRPDVWELLEVASRHMTLITRFELGAVVVVTPMRGDMPHVGIVGDYRHGGWSFIHASNMTSPARVVETRLMNRISVRVHALFRLPGIN